MINISEIKILFEDIISLSEKINSSNSANISEEEFTEIEQCLGILYDFGHFVKKRLTQMSVNSKLPENDKKPGEDEKKKEETVIKEFSSQENIVGESKPHSFDITGRKKHRKPKVHQTLDNNYIDQDEHTDYEQTTLTRKTIIIRRPKEELRCIICSEELGTVSNMENHMKSKHTDIKLKCGECPFTAQKKRQVQLHKQSNHQGFTYPCSHCKFIANKYEILKGHLKMEHQKATEYECEICGYCTKEKIEYRKHLKIVHKKK